MATPRKHWFRVADSVAIEPWSNDVAATFLRLGAMLNTRWARDGKSATQACSITLRPADLQALTGSLTLVRARRIVHELAVYVSLTVDEQGKNTSLTWPKFSEFQRYESRPGVQPETDAPPDLPPPQDAPARRKTPPQEKEPPPPAPDIASPDDWALPLSDLMIELLQAVPGAVISRGARKSWAKEIARLARDAPELRDAEQQPPTDHLEAGIRWALGEQNLGREYEVVIRSGKSLREKWPKLVAAGRRASGHVTRAESKNEQVVRQMFADVDAGRF